MHYALCNVNSGTYMQAAGIHHLEQAVSPASNFGDRKKKRIETDRKTDRKTASCNFCGYNYRIYTCICTYIT